MGRLFLFLTTIIFISCSSATSLRRPPDQAKHKKQIYYSVKPGDSLWKISKHYGVSVDELMRVNRIPSARSLKVGQKIAVPSYRRRGRGSFSWPLEGEVVNYFGESLGSSINRGVNIQVQTASKDVKAVAKGKVVFADQLKGWGHTVILQHFDEFYTIYANLKPPLIGEGIVAEQNQVIGQVASGRNGNHILHFEIRKRYIPQDPLSYLN